MYSRNVFQKLVSYNGMRKVGLHRSYRSRWAKATILALMSRVWINTIRVELNFTVITNVHRVKIQMCIFETFIVANITDVYGLLK